MNLFPFSHSCVNSFRNDVTAPFFVQEGSAGCSS
jgi:hypothetical protein